MPFQMDGRDAMMAGTQMKGPIYLSARVDKDGDAISKNPGDIVGTLTVKTLPAKGRRCSSTRSCRWKTCSAKSLASPRRPSCSCRPLHLARRRYADGARTEGRPVCSSPRCSRRWSPRRRSVLAGRTRSHRVPRERRTVAVSGIEKGIGMPNYGRLKELVSHRVTFEYDTGARIVGYIAACKPGTEPCSWCRCPVSISSTTRAS